MAPTIQIFGTKKCHETAKAIRFFKERSVKFQFIDLTEKAPSRGELESIARKIPLEELLDRNSKQYKARQLEYKVFDIFEELLADPLLLRTPITRFGQEAALGVTPDVWKRWLELSK